jgi:transposase
MLEKNIKTQAKAMYLAGESAQRISKELDVSLNTVKYWIDKGNNYEAAWKDIKKAESDVRLLEMLKDKKSSMDDIFSLGMQAIYRGVAHIELNKVVLETSGMAQLVKILESVDKWQRMDAEALADADSLSIEEAEESIQEHPFFSEDD